MRPALFAFCLLLSAAVRPLAAAPARPADLRSDILYTAKGQFVQVGPMRLLTPNAAAEQFQYDPTGTEVAVVGSESQDGRTVHFAEVIDPASGRMLGRLAVPAPVGDGGAGFTLLGWSVSGKFLLLQRFTPTPKDPKTLAADYLRWDLSARPPVARVISPENHLPQGVQLVRGSDYSFASPDRRWTVFGMSVQGKEAGDKPGGEEDSLLLYDPERDIFRPLTLPAGAINTSQWSDNSHLSLWQDDARKQLDVVTGQVSPRAEAGDTPAPVPVASGQYPSLALGVENRTLEDAAGSGGRRRAYIVWIRRVPQGGAPLGAVAAGVMPDNHEPGDSGDGGSGSPQATWSPSGDQVAFLANNGLYVTDLTAPADPLPREKMAVGLPLTCADEQALAVSNLNRIGRALTQYAQNSSEHYPAEAGVEDKLAPYLGTRDVFSVGARRWTYHTAPNLLLPAGQSPADAVQGTMDLPCARVALFYDGHVQAFPKTQAAEGGK